MKMSLSLSGCAVRSKREPSRIHAPTPILGSKRGFSGGGGGGVGGSVMGVEAASAAPVGATTSDGGGVGRAAPAASPGSGSAARAIAGSAVIRTTTASEQTNNEPRVPSFFFFGAIPCDLLRAVDCMPRAAAFPEPARAVRSEDQQRPRAPARGHHPSWFLAVTFR